METRKVPARIKLRDDMPLDPYPYTKRYHFESYSYKILRERGAVLEAKVITTGKRLVYVVNIIKEVYGENGGCIWAAEWQFCKNHPKFFGQNGWHYFDFSYSTKHHDEITSKIGEMYVVAEADPNLVEKKINKRELDEIAYWVIAYINQEREKRQKTY